MDCVCHILGTLLPGLRNPVVVQHACYLLSAEEKLDNISNGVEDLKAKRSDICTMIITGERKRERPTEEVKRWLTRVENIEADVTALKNSYEQSDSCFIKDFFPNCCSNYQVNKKATKLQEDVEELKKEWGSFSSILMPSPPEYINEMPMPPEITEEGSIDFVFPNLRELCMDGLPQLRSICRQAIKFPSLESIVILGCPQLKKLPFHSQMVINNDIIKLKCIGGNWEWLKCLEWDNDDAKSSFGRYFWERLTI